MLNNLSLQVRSSTSNDELDRRYQCYKLRHPRSPPFNLSLGCESWGVRGGGEQLQHEHNYLRPRTLQSGQSAYQKINYIHRPSTIAFFHHPHISEFLSNITMSGCGTFSTSRYSDVVATSIVVISDLDFRFSGIEFLIFNCVARRHA